MGDAKPVDDGMYHQYTRRKFTQQEVELLLAGEYDAFCDLTGCKKSTARRYGHHVRHAHQNAITIVAKSKPHKPGSRKPEPTRTPGLTRTSDFHGFDPHMGF